MVTSLLAAFMSTLDLFEQWDEFFWYLLVIIASRDVVYRMLPQVISKLREEVPPVV